MVGDLRTKTEEDMVTTIGNGFEVKFNQLINFLPNDLTLDMVSRVERVNQVQLNSIESSIRHSLVTSCVCVGGRVQRMLLWVLINGQSN